MKLEKVFDKVVEITNMQPLEVTFWLIIIALFVWLQKEFKTQYQKNKELKATKTDKALTNLSKVLAISHQYKTNSGKLEEYYATLYECFTIMDGNLIRKIKSYIKDNAITEIQKIDRIEATIYEEIIYFSNENKSLYPIKSGIEGIDYLFNKLKDIVLPIGYAFTTIFTIFLLLGLGIGRNNIFLKIAAPTAFVILIILITGFFDIHQKKKLKKTSYILITIMILSLIFILTSTSLAIALILIVVFLVSLILFFNYGIRK
ncbi:hypothetical protein [Bacillus salipaludis]|uniref:Uncharacterized protein n=1 Tax=Bacillus salipaludis TaxID=2547811 RepID=A0AA90TWG9_9BACI|nr:hypothetical protein [Bacillus salipaludis]MDQ6600754.1 hypothetical protein [Bacillus salipaludis]